MCHQYATISPLIASKGFSMTVLKYTFMNRQIIDISGVDRKAVYSSFTSLGGKKGWLVYNYLWQLRGMIDKLIGGVGLRGRKSSTQLNMGDVVDFWKVADIRLNRSLLLKAEMKIPGDAWLEFKIENNEFIQSAYYLPKGFFGGLYWYFFIPFHFFIFKDMANKIVSDAKGVM